MQRLAFKTTGIVLGRFIPPWEKEGVDADDYFSGLLTSSNPFQKAKRDRKRYEEMREVMEEEQSQDDATDLGSKQRLEEERARQQEKTKEAEHFLPYGAVPHQFGKVSELPSWGTYESQIHASPYSAETKARMMADADTLLPYKYETLVPLMGDESKVVKEDGKKKKKLSKKEAAAAVEKPLWPLHGTTGFVLDIDGVVYRSKQMLPGSKDAIQQMQKLKIPFVFMTNGGGCTEEKKAEELSKLIEIDIRPEQCILSHSPMQRLAKQYENENVLIVGPRGSHEAALRYGFKKAIYMEDFQADHPELCPFKIWHKHEEVSKRVKAPNSVPFPQFAAIFCFNDSPDVLNDVQVIIDVLCSPFGQVGTTVAGQQTLPVYFSNDDLLWATNAPLPRLGMGAFREMLASCYESVTGNAIQMVQYGKPRKIAYYNAEKVLEKEAAFLGWNPQDLRTICMIGDNLETDILGANAAGGKWLSVHVMTGVGSAPSAIRTHCPGDEEAVWLAETVDKNPHYVAPSLDHFLREMMSFGEAAVTMNKTAQYIAPCPADLSQYGVDPLSE